MRVRYNVREKISLNYPCCIAIRSKVYRFVYKASHHVSIFCTPFMGSFVSVYSLRRSFVLSGFTACLWSLASAGGFDERLFYYFPVNEYVFILRNSW